MINPTKIKVDKTIEMLENVIKLKAKYYKETNRLKQLNENSEKSS